MFLSRGVDKFVRVRGLAQVVVVERKGAGREGEGGGRGRGWEAEGEKGRLVFTREHISLRLVK